MNRNRQINMNWNRQIEQLEKGLFQFYGVKFISPESLEHWTSVMVRYATDFHPVAHHRKISMEAVFNEFIKVEEMTI